MKNQFFSSEILTDIEQKLKIKIDERDLCYFTSGKSEATVFSIREQFLIKICSRPELLVYQTFLSKNKTSYFQKIKYINFDLGYICLTFTKGHQYQDDLSVEYLLSTVFNITSNYQQIDYQGFGYLFEDHKTWSEFLGDEVSYSTSILGDDLFDIVKVQEALSLISKYPVGQFLLHGDLGVHNFIVNRSKLYVIDPMGLVGDPVYDFYYALFSDHQIFLSLSLDLILNYFNRDINYKKMMIIIVFYIRLCRAFKYDHENYRYYLDYYCQYLNKLSLS